MDLFTYLNYTDGLGAALIQEIVDSVAEHKQMEMMSMMMLGKTAG